jgi:hypothetical protein
MAIFSLKCSQHLIQKFIKAKYWHDVKYINDETVLDSERKAIFEDTTSVEAEFAGFYSTQVVDELDSIRKYLRSRCLPSRNKSVEHTIILNDDIQKSDSMNDKNKLKVNIINYTEEKKGKAKNFDDSHDKNKPDNKNSKCQYNKENETGVDHQNNIENLGYEIFKNEIDKDKQKRTGEAIDEEGEKIKTLYWESVIHKSKLKDRYSRKNNKNILDKKMKADKRSETHSVNRKEKKKKSKKEEETKGKKGKKKNKAEKTKWIEKIEEEGNEGQVNPDEKISYKETEEKENQISKNDAKVKKNKEGTKKDEENNYHNKEKKDKQSENLNVISKERYIFLTNNKYRRKRNYNKRQEEIEEAQKKYQANLSLTESKPSVLDKKELGDLDSKDIEKILEMDANEGEDKEKGNKKEGFRTKILKSLQKEIGLPCIPPTNKKKDEVDSKGTKKDNENNVNNIPKKENDSVPIVIEGKKNDSLESKLEKDCTKDKENNSQEGIKKQIIVSKIDNNLAEKKEGENKLNCEKTKNSFKVKLDGISAKNTDNKSQYIDYNKYFGLGGNKNYFYKNTNTQGHINVPGVDSGATRAIEGVSSYLFLCNNNTTTEINKPDLNEKKISFPQEPGPVFSDTYNKHYFFDNNSNSTIININPAVSHNSNSLNEKFISVDNKFIQSFTNNNIFTNKNNNNNNGNINTNLNSNILLNKNLSNNCYECTNNMNEKNNKGNIQPINPFNITPKYFTNNNINNNQTNVSDNKPYNPFIEFSKNFTLNCNANNIFMNNNIKKEEINNNNNVNSNINTNNNTIIINNNNSNERPHNSNKNEVVLSPEKRSSIIKNIENTFESYKKQYRPVECNTKRKLDNFHLPKYNVERLTNYIKEYTANDYMNLDNLLYEDKIFIQQYNFLELYDGNGKLRPFKLDTVLSIFKFRFILEKLSEPKFYFIVEVNHNYKGERANLFNSFLIHENKKDIRLLGDVFEPSIRSFSDQIENIYSEPKYSKFVSKELDILLLKLGMKEKFFFNKNRRKYPPIMCLCCIENFNHDNLKKHFRDTKHTKSTELKKLFEDNEISFFSQIFEFCGQNLFNINYLGTLANVLFDKYGEEGIIKIKIKEFIENNTKAKTYFFNFCYNYVSIIDENKVKNKNPSQKILFIFQSIYKDYIKQYLEEEEEKKNKNK